MVDPQWSSTGEISTRGIRSYPDPSVVWRKRRLGCAETSEFTGARSALGPLFVEPAFGTNWTTTSVVTLMRLARHSTSRFCGSNCLHLTGRFSPRPSFEWLCRSVDPAGDKHFIVPFFVSPVCRLPFSTSRRQFSHHTPPTFSDSFRYAIGSSSYRAPRAFARFKRSMRGIDRKWRCTNKWDATADRSVYRSIDLTVHD
jgi:hypothetical protein